MTSQPNDPLSTPGAGGSAGGVLVVLQQMQHQMGELNQSLWAAHGPADLMDAVAALETLKATADAVELPGDPDLLARAVLVLLEEARRLDATELRKVTRRLLSIVDPDRDERRDETALDREERAAHLNRNLSITDDRAGGAFIKGRCSSEDAALIKSALVPLAAPHPSAGPVCDPGTCVIPGCGHDGRDARDHGARLLDALTELCRRSQTAEVLPDCHGASPRVTITMDLDDLRDGTGFGVTETGEDLSAATVRRMCCDAEIIAAVLGSRAEVLDVGRLRRLVTPGDLEGPRRPRPALPVPELHPPTGDVPRPPHPALGRRRPAYVTDPVSHPPTTDQQPGRCTSKQGVGCPPRSPGSTLWSE